MTVFFSFLQYKYTRVGLFLFQDECKIIQPGNRTAADGVSAIERTDAETTDGLHRSRRGIQVRSIDWNKITAFSLLVLFDRRLNAQLEAKTQALVEEAEQVLVTDWHSCCLFESVLQSFFLYRETKIGSSDRQQTTEKRSVYSTKSIRTITYTGSQKRWSFV